MATTAEKHAKISAAILSRRAAGQSVQEAMDAVLGTGTYDALVSGLYDALRAKAQGKVQQ